MCLLVLIVKLCVSSDGHIEGVRQSCHFPGQAAGFTDEGIDEIVAGAKGQVELRVPGQAAEDVLQDNREWSDVRRGRCTSAHAHN